MRRVLVVSHSLSGGGAERVTSTVLGGLDRRRFEVHLALCVNQVTYPPPADVPIVALEQQGILTTARTIRRLAAEIDRLRPDVVVSNIDYTTLFTGLALRRTKHRPRWIARLGLNPRRKSFSWLDAVARRMLRRLYRGVDQFVANSRGLAACFADEFNVSPEKVAIIFNPVDAAALDRQAAEAPALQRKSVIPLLVFAGRLHRQKRPDMFLNAVRLIAADRPVQAWILGDGPLRTQVEAQIARDGLQSSVRCFGFQANPFPLLAQADVFVLTSDHEGLPNALLEAQALGLPAVAADCPFGPAEIVIPGQTGRLTPCGDAAAIAASICELLGDPDALLRMGHAAREHIRSTFALPPILDRWRELLEQSSD